MWYVCDVLYAVLYVHVKCAVVRGSAVSRSYIVLLVFTFTISYVLCVLMVEGICLL